METIRIAFYGFLDSLPNEDYEKIKAFFSEFDLNFSVSKTEKRKFKYDFERAIMTLYDKGVPMDKILRRLSLSNLSGFYARPSVMWFPLDDAAKIYPISMDHDRQLMFRLSVYLKEDVIPEILQIALTFAIKRFPSFATTLKKGVFWHYLDAVKKRFTVEEESDVPCQAIKVSISGSNSFRLMYYKNRISAEFFHVLTDGTGGLAFLKVVAAEYLRLLGTDVADGERGDLLDINDIPLREEFENSFVKVERAKTSSGFVDKNALQMNGKLSRRRPCRVLHFKMDSQKLYETAKAHGATVTTYVLALMFLACSASTDELTGDINIQVPVNMRKFYPSRTLRNFSMYCGIRIPVENVKDKDSLIPEIASQLTEKGDKERMHEMITAAVNIVSSIRLIPLVVKQPIAKMVYGFIGEKIYTTTFSNLGVVNMPAPLCEHIESMDFCLGAQELNRLATTLITFGGVSTFSISKMTADPTFEETMYKLFLRDGIDVQVEGSDYYAN